MRKFESGATRDVDTNKLDLEGFLHPSVLERFAEYMHENRIQADGNIRASDNWQKGIPKDAYMKSAFRHFFDVWKEHRGMKTSDGIEKAICALMFNIQGYLFEHLKEKQVAKSQEEHNRRVIDFLSKEDKEVLQALGDEASSEPPVPSVAILAADSILAIHPQWPEGEVDPLAPESCVSRCY